jgi:hypothetical protein
LAKAFKIEILWGCSMSLSAYSILLTFLLVRCVRSGALDLGVCLSCAARVRPLEAIIAEHLPARVIGRDFLVALWRDHLQFQLPVCRLVLVAQVVQEDVLEFLWAGFEVTKDRDLVAQEVQICSLTHGHLDDAILRRNFQHDELSRSPPGVRVEFMNLLAVVLALGFLTRDPVLLSLARNSLVLLELGGRLIISFWLAITVLLFEVRLIFDIIFFGLFPLILQIFLGLGSHGLNLWQFSFDKRAAAYVFETFAGFQFLLGRHDLTLHFRGGLDTRTCG